MSKFALISVTAMQISTMLDSRYLYGIAFDIDSWVRCMDGARGQLQRLSHLLCPFASSSYIFSRA